MLAAGSLVGGAPAHAVAVQALQTQGLQTQQAEPQGCPVAQGSLSWGVKESFRAYVLSAIAQGSVSAGDGAVYETPTFTWATASGSIDPSTGAGLVTFAGYAAFQGHDGQLNLTFANPGVEFVSGTEAYLVADVRSKRLNSDEYIDAQGVRLGKLKLTSIPSIETGAVLAFDAIPVTLTPEGVAPFADFYAAGDALDPITLSLTMGECTQSGSGSGPTKTANATPTPEQTASPAGSETGDSDLLWVWIAAVVIVAAIPTAVIVLRRRARK